VTDIVAPRPAPGEAIASAWGGEVHDAIEGIQTGYVVVPATGSGVDVSTVVVTFPRAYTAPPTVVAGINAGTKFYMVMVTATTATTVTLQTTRKDGATPLAATGVNWIAIGKPA